METLTRAIIKTRFAGPTNSRGSRIIVSSQLGKSSIAYPYELSVTDSHVLAVRDHLKRYGVTWDKFTVGSDDKGYYFTVSDNFNLLEL